MVTNSSRRTFLLFLIIGIAVGLRIYGITFPKGYQADEETFVSIAFRFLSSRDLNPHYFGHPGSVLMYGLTIVYGVYFLVGWGVRNFVDFAALEAGFYNDPTVYFWLGRLAAVIVGTLSVYLVYKIADEAFRDKNVGLIAALFLAVIPLHARHSKYVRPDVMATFFILASIYNSLKGLDKDETQ